MVDKNDQEHHNTPAHYHVSIHDEQYPHQSYMTWIILVQKPRGNILTEFLRITVSRMVDARHVPQCRNQTKDAVNRSFSLDVIQTIQEHIVLLHKSVRHHQDHPTHDFECQ